MVLEAWRKDIYSETDVLIYLAKTYHLHILFEVMHNLKSNPKIKISHSTPTNCGSSSGQSVEKRRVQRQNILQLNLVKLMLAFFLPESNTQAGTRDLSMFMMMALLRLTMVLAAHDLEITIVMMLTMFVINSPLQKAHKT